MFGPLVLFAYVLFVMLGAFITRDTLTKLGWVENIIVHSGLIAVMMIGNPWVFVGYQSVNMFSHWLFHHLYVDQKMWDDPDIAVGAVKLGFTLEEYKTFSMHVGLAFSTAVNSGFYIAYQLLS